MGGGDSNDLKKVTNVSNLIMFSFPYYVCLTVEVYEFCFPNSRATILIRTKIHHKTDAS